MKSRVDIAEKLFREGYNCSQAVFGTYGDLYGLERDMAMRLAASFGGGMGRMREVCGTLSGVFLIAGMETGATEGRDAAGKKRNYDMVQRLAAEYRRENGSIICRELLGLDKNGKNVDTSVTTPDARTDEYYKKRPCIQLIRRAAQLAEELLLYDRFSCDAAVFVRVKSDEQLAELAQIANEVWHQHFASILSSEQIDYMVAKFQSKPAMREQMEYQEYEYYFIQAAGVNVGYVGIKPDGDRLFLSKLYILKRYRGNGYASGAFEFMRRICKLRGLRAVWLTVNRYNADTIAIYKKKGFVVTEEKVTDIGNGFVMDDYFMEWQIEEKVRD